MKNTPVHFVPEFFHAVRESKGRLENSPVDCFQAVGDSHAAESGIIGMINTYRGLSRFVIRAPSFTMKKTPVHFVPEFFHAAGESKGHR